MIHAAAMGDEPASRESIEGSTRHSLELADQNGIKTIAFPILASGIAGFPLEEAAGIMVEVIREYIADGSTQIDEVVLYGWSAADADTVRSVVEKK